MIFIDYIVIAPMLIVINIIKKRQMEMKKNRSSEDGRSEDVHSQVYCQGLR
jgi:hypothetical protein